MPDVNCTLILLSPSLSRACKLPSGPAASSLLQDTMQYIKELEPVETLPLATVSLISTKFWTSTCSYFLIIPTCQEIMNLGSSHRDVFTATRWWERLFYRTWIQVKFAKSKPSFCWFEYATIHFPRCFISASHPTAPASCSASGNKQGVQLNSQIPIVAVQMLPLHAVSDVRCSGCQ